MPRKPLKPCRRPGCPELTEDRFCPKHMKEYNRRYNREERPEYSKRLYKTARWQRLRKRVLLKHPLCAECERQGRVTKATVVGHIIPHKGNPEPFWDENNLQLFANPAMTARPPRKGGGEKRVRFTLTDTRG